MATAPCAHSRCVEITVCSGSTAAHAISVSFFPRLNRLALQVGADADDELMSAVSAPGRPPSSLYVGNLNVRVTETQLVEVFASIGPVKSCKIKNPSVRGGRAHAVNS